MQALCWGAPEAPRVGLAKGTAQSSALEDTIFPQDPRKGSVTNIKALHLTSFLEEVMGNPAEHCLGVQNALTVTHVPIQISCTVWVPPGLEKILPMGPHPGPATGHCCRMLRRP